MSTSNRRDITTWRKQIDIALAEACDPGPIIAITPVDLDLDLEFDNGYGGIEGEPFTAWTETRVYFPLCYDGSEWAGSAPRNPCDEATAHLGG